MRRDQGFKQRVRSGIADLFLIWKEEVKLTFSDQGILIFFFVVPLFYPLLYAFIYDNEVAREVPAVVVDESHSALSREFARKMDATADVRVVAYAADLKEAQGLLKERKAYGIYVIPADFSKNVHRGEQTFVTLFADMGSLLHYKNLLITATNVSLEMNRAIKISLAQNTTEREEEIAATPIAYEEVTMFNTQNGFASFLLPGVLILIIQQTLLLGIGMSAGTTRERNLYHHLVPASMHYNGALRIVLGKALCYFMIYAVMSVYVTRLVPYFFDLPQLERPATLLLFLLPYLAACIFFAMTLSAVITNRENVMVVFVFTSVPLLFLSGISWPGSAIAPFWKCVSWLFPSTFGINGYVRIHTMGATLSDVRVEYGALWIQAGVYFIITCLIYRRQVLFCRKRRLDKYRKTMGRVSDDIR